jgi:hypothetical protein
MQGIGTVSPPAVGNYAVGTSTVTAIGIDELKKLLDGLGLIF